MNDKTPKLTIGYICTTPFCHESFVTYMMDLVHFNMLNGITAAYVKCNNGSQAAARNELVRMATGEYLFMVDTDMAFSPITVQALLSIADSGNLDVLSGLYYRRLPPYSPLVYKDENCKFVEYDPFTSVDPIVEVAATGAGCLLIRNTVFKRIKEELKEDPFSIINPLSEDLSFFKRLQKLKIKTYLAKTVRCGHLSNVMIGKEHHDIYKKQHQ